MAHDARNQWLQASDHPASCHEADEGSDHVALFGKFLSKDFPSTAAALAMAKIALDSEGLEEEGVHCGHGGWRGSSGGVVSLRVAASSALRSSFWRWSE